MISRLREKCQTPKAYFSWKNQLELILQGFPSCTSFLAVN